MIKNLISKIQKKHIIFFAIILIIAAVIISCFFISKHFKNVKEEKEMQMRIDAVREAILPIARRYGIFLSGNDIEIIMSYRQVTGISSFRFKGMPYSDLLSIAYLVAELGEIEDPVDPTCTITFASNFFNISTPTDDYTYVSQLAIAVDHMVYNGSDYPYPGLYRLNSHKCLCRLE